MIGNEAPTPDASHILVVEDNELNMELVRDILRAYGYRVGEAFNGQACLNYLEQEIPDLILMDLQLPDVNGYTLVQKLRTDVRCQTLPIVAVTAFAMKGDREKAMNAGCTGVIMKPIDTRAFPRQVEAYLRGFSEQGPDT
ncbi:MAG: response regulator [Candidatus Firestonebacteria bacterium]|nr:response regulator [Candidatus Firestonebacteria bacterium]